MSNYNTAIAARIEAYAKAANIDKDSIADELEIGRSTFYDRLNGKRRWYLDEARALAKMLGCTVDELMTMPVC